VGAGGHYLEAVLCAVGDLVEDVVAHLDGPLRTGADAAARVSRHRGGSAANVAAVAARISGASRFAGAVGVDETGDRLLAGLEALGVHCHAPRRGRTGTIVALVETSGERTFATDRGAAPLLTTLDADLLDGVSVLHLPGYGLARDPMATAVRAVAEAAHERSIPVAVDPSSLSLGAELGIESYREAMAGLVPDVLLPNRSEAAQLDLLDRPLAPLTVVTAGPLSTIALDGDQRLEVPVTPRDAVDTTGAGDAFSAGFLVSWSAGASVEQAVGEGHAAAARVIGGPGADWWEEG
jgi:sugar/nucleoside kinase (ribokinase family)